MPPLLIEPDGHIHLIEDGDMPVGMHIGSSGLTPIPDPQAPFALIPAVVSVAGMLAMSNFLSSSICHRFPNIKIVWSEAAIGWIPFQLERLDRQLERHVWSVQNKSADLKPSEIFRRNMPYGNVEDHGTVFVGFSTDQKRLSRMLDSMAGLTTGTRDALTRFTQPLTGSYYFVPSVESLRQLRENDRTK